ncbi:MAG TPA: hypothetical protein VEB21_14675, partial [Terriglobales bacterium]|nr:hypothetical protein [Terriglobales bacterium]
MTQALRLRSTRSLWDPSYVDESWIGEAVRLIPRMRAWVDTHYPGTKLAVTEYNWGALEHINGALAQADVLGIFGREGLDLATLWDPPTAAEPGAFAFRMFRNFDGQGAQFGDASIAATSADQGQLAIYAAERSSDGAVTLVIINKGTQALTSSVALVGYGTSGEAEVFRYSAANLGAIVALPQQTVGLSGFTATFPASSITLMVLPPSGTAPATGTATPTRTATASATQTAPPAATSTPTLAATATLTFTRTATPTATPAFTATAPLSCGDGSVDTGEQCDDGDRDDGDGCNSACRYELIPGSTSGNAKLSSAACIFEWSVVNPGNTPAT